jgi:hypothetical protein
LWASFLALNTLLFLPLFLLDGGDNTLIPPAHGGESAWALFSNYALWRANLDPFRINVEFALLVALWIAAPTLRRIPYRVFFYVFYVIALFYAIYEAVVLSIWLIEPVFYSQWFLARDGLPFLLQNLDASIGIFVVACGAVVLAAVTIGVLLRVLLAAGASPKLSWGWKGAMMALAVFALLSATLQGGNARKPEMVQSSTTAKIVRNIADSIALHATVVAFDDATLRAAYNFDAQSLQRHPDIFVIFVESYGSVLYKRDDWKVAYGALVDELNSTLADSGWHTVSAFSTSPTWGGGSWLAYTSALMGTTIETQPQYLDLRERYATDPYPNMGRVLQEKGYWFAWLSALDDNYNDVKWASLERFYGTDQMIRYEDLDYRGDGFGWGNAPPDQYTLNKTIEMLRDQQRGKTPSAGPDDSSGATISGATIPGNTVPGSTIPGLSNGNETASPITDAADKPLLLYTITQNSHYPFAPQPPLAAEWRDLVEQPSNAEARESALAAEPPARRANYLQAIDYQLRMLVDLVIQQGDDNSLFILVGDHQPPTVSRRADGFETPVHIISRNQAILEAFARNGFTPGLHIPEGTEAVMRHADLYSLLMKDLVGDQVVAELP